MYKVQRKCIWPSHKIFTLVTGSVIPDGLSDTHCEYYLVNKAEVAQAKDDAVI